MTEHQYRQLLWNRRASAVTALFAGVEPETLLRAAARAIRQRRRAERALAGVLSPEVLAATDVEGLGEGVLSLIVRDSLIFERLRRETPKLRRELSREVPGLREVRGRA
jgi:hypothetical protein